MTVFPLMETNVYAVKNHLSHPNQVQFGPFEGGSDSAGIRRTFLAIFAYMKAIPELQALLQRVENKYGRAIATTSAFEALSIDIERHTGERISSSSLKRFWGYVNSDTAPRVASLDILAKYIGQKDFNSFCKSNTAILDGCSCSTHSFLAACRKRIG